MLAACVAGGASLAVLGWRGADRWMRPEPSDSARSSPRDYALTAEVVAFPSRDGTPLSGWFVPAGDPAGTGGPHVTEPTIVLLHGLRSSRASMLPHAAYLHRAGYNVLLLDFRGSGDSGDAAVTFGAREQHDVLGALDYLEARGFDMRRVGLQGVSMGAVVALLVAAEEPRVRAVVAEAPFSDFPAVVEASYLGRPEPLRRLQTWATVRMLNRRLDIDVGEISAVAAARRLGGRSLLVIEDELDANVPDGSARAVYAVASGPRHLWRVDGAAHGGGHARAQEEYERRVLDFWAAAFAG